MCSYVIIEAVSLYYANTKMKRIYKRYHGIDTFELIEAIENYMVTQRAEVKDEIRVQIMAICCSLQFEGNHHIRGRGEHAPPICTVVSYKTPI